MTFQSLEGPKPIKKTVRFQSPIWMVSFAISPTTWPFEGSLAPSIILCGEAMGIFGNRSDFRS